jgi:hypothetical protein
LSQQVVAVHAGTLLQRIDRLGSKGVGEAVRRDGSVLTVADPGLDDVAEAAALKPVDEPIEAAVALALLMIETGVWAGARLAIARTWRTTSRAVEHARQVAEIALPRRRARGAFVVTLVPSGAGRAARILAEPAHISVLVLTALGRLLAMPAAEKIAEAARSLGHQEHQERLDDGRHRSSEPAPETASTAETSAATLSAALRGVPAPEHLAKNTADDLIEQTHNRFSPA